MLPNCNSSLSLSLMGCCCRCRRLTQRDDGSPTTNANTNQQQQHFPRRNHTVNLYLPLVSRKEEGKPRKPRREARSSSGFLLKSIQRFYVMLVFNGYSAFCEEQRRNRSSREMESLKGNGECVGEGLEKEEEEEEGGGMRERVSGSVFLTLELEAEATVDEGSDDSSLPLLPPPPKEYVNDGGGNAFHSEYTRKLEKQASAAVSEIEVIKERFAKLLLGEDMSGSGNGICTTLGISNAVTNLCATIFYQLWRLEPLRPEKKAMWRREMEWLLCVSDHIVKFTPALQNFPDGSKIKARDLPLWPAISFNSAGWGWK